MKLFLVPLWNFTEGIYSRVSEARIIPVSSVYWSLHLLPVIDKLHWRGDHKQQEPVGMMNLYNLLVIVLDTVLIVTNLFWNWQCLEPYLNYKIKGCHPN